jgi:ribosomal protein L29
MAKKTDIKNNTDRELLALVTEKREALRQVRFATSGSKGRDVKKLRESKKEIARALTELSQRAAH